LIIQRALFCGEAAMPDDGQRQRPHLKARKDHRPAICWHCKRAAEGSDLVKLGRTTMRIRRLAATVLALGLTASVAHGQDKWPSKPVTVIVPFGAGGNTDVLARIYAERLSARLGQQFVIENRAGAGGTTGLVAMTKATPDGYTIAVGTGSGIATNPVIMKDKLAYDPAKDFAYLHLMATQPNMLVVHPGVPAKDLAEFIAWLKANPDQAYATSGSGSSQHLCGEMLMQMSGVKMNAVAYRASNQQMQDLIGGQIKIACDNFSTAWEQVKGNNVRALAITSTKRYPFSPDVPTFAETFPGFEVLAWFGWIAPTGVPKEIIDKLISELDAIGKEPDVRKRLETFTVEYSGLSGKAFADFAEKERQALGPIVEKAGIKAP
jgi:tripartite-type tricarboxylate transporter receptor subunit TctC